MCIFNCLLFLTRVRGWVGSLSSTHHSFGTQHNLRSSSLPPHLVIVNASSLPLPSPYKIKALPFASVQIREGAPPGRGQCHSLALSMVETALVTFCHADTSLPICWDVRVRSSLRPGSGAAMHAFRFSMSHVEEVPWGWVVEVAVRVRCGLFRLPYGDQALSFDTAGLRSNGGYPRQCVMEDYALVDYYRRHCNVVVEENVKSVTDNRRWKAKGVREVARVNKEAVEVYGDEGPRGVWRRYYGGEFEGEEG